MFEGIQHYVLALPPTSQAALIASVVTLGGGFLSAVIGLAGVWVTNNAHERRLTRQLRVEDDRKKADREIELRKEIYLEVADAIHSYQSAIGKLMDLEMDINSIMKEFSSKRCAFARANLVAGARLLSSIYEFHLESSSRIIEISFMRLGVINLKNQLETINKEKEKLVIERDNALASIRKNTLSGEMDDKKMNGVAQLFSLTDGHINNLTQSEIEPNKQLQTSLLEFLAKCRNANSKMSQLVPRLVAEIRAELGLEIDFAEFEKLFLAAAERQDKTFSDFVEKLKNGTITF